VLIGFLTGVGIQVAMGQLSGMLGVPEPHVSAHAISGTVIKFWDTLSELGQTSGATLAVSLTVIAVLVVFGRWIKAVPGGLVAVVGAIVVSYAFSLSSHGVTILGPVPRGLPHLGLPSGISWSDVPKLVGTSASMFLVILAQSAATSRAYAVKYRERLAENDDLVGLAMANVAAGLSSTFVVNGSPTKTEMVDEAKSHTQVAQLTTAVVVAIVLLFLTKPLQYLPNAVLSAVVFVIGVKLIDVRHMRQIYALRKDEFTVAALTTVVVVCVGVEQGIILAIVLSIVLHVRRHYLPHNTVVTLDSSGDLVMHPPSIAANEIEPGIVVYRFAVGIFYANAERLAEDVTMLVDRPSPPRWFVLMADGIDDADYTGGMALVELAEQLEARKIVLAIAEASDALKKELDRLGVTARIGEDHYYDTVSDALKAFNAS